MQAKKTEDRVRLGAAGRPLRPIDESARLGEEIYKRDIKPLVEADHVGEVVSIDVETGAWVMGKDLLTAAKLLRERRPDVNDIWSERVGYPAMGSIGGGSFAQEIPE